MEQPHPDRPARPPEVQRWIEADEPSAGSDSVSISQRLRRERLVSGSGGRPEPIPRGVRVAVAAAVGLVALALLASGIVGVARVTGADRSAATADEVLRYRVEQEVLVLQRPFLAADADEARARFGAARAARDPEGRRAEVRALVEVLEAELSAAPPPELGGEARRQGLERAVRALREGEAESAARQAERDAARATLVGRLLTLLGA